MNGNPKNTKKNHESNFEALFFNFWFFSTNEVWYRLLLNVKLFVLQCNSMIQKLIG